MATDRLEAVLKRYLLAEFDEFHRLNSYEYLDEDYSLPEEVERYLEDMYLEGFSSAFYLLGRDIQAPNPTFILAALWATFEGKTFRDRLESAVGEQEVWRIARTEGHRVFVIGQEDGARQVAETTGEGIRKVWVSEMDGLERSTHHNLHDNRQPLDGWFVTPNGRAQRPGTFGVAEEDVNCRCILRFTTD